MGREGWGNLIREEMRELSTYCPIPDQSSLQRAMLMFRQWISALCPYGGPSLQASLVANLIGSNTCLQSLASRAVHSGFPALLNNVIMANESLGEVA
jgi:hypothetical protein